MSDIYIGDLTPGTYVINVKKESEWGIGQVQSSINNKITNIYFNHRNFYLLTNSFFCFFMHLLSF